jgi:hypothetical protein
MRWFELDRTGSIAAIKHAPSRRPCQGCLPWRPINPTRVLDRFVDRRESDNLYGYL